MGEREETARPDRAVVAYVHRTESGEFWHMARPGLIGRASYVFTLCGRRLGRWNLLPARARAEVPTEALCLGCRRKGAR